MQSKTDLSRRLLLTPLRFTRPKESHKCHRVGITETTGSESYITLITRIGAGSGIFTRGLLSHPAWSESIQELRAVEPSEGMRAVFTKLISDKRVSVSEGTFDHTGAEDGWANLIVIATVSFTSLLWTYSKLNNCLVEGIPLVS